MLTTPAIDRLEGNCRHVDGIVVEVVGEPVTVEQGQGGVGADSPKVETGAGTDIGSVAFWNAEPDARILAAVEILRDVPDDCRERRLSAVRHVLARNRDHRRGNGSAADPRACHDYGCFGACFGGLFCRPAGRRGSPPDEDRSIALYRDKTAAAKQHIDRAFEREAAVKLRRSLSRHRIGGKIDLAARGLSKRPKRCPQILRGEMVFAHLLGRCRRGRRHQYCNAGSRCQKSLNPNRSHSRPFPARRSQGRAGTSTSEDGDL
jgi:hypothetical protein